MVEGILDNAADFGFRRPERLDAVLIAPGYARAFGAATVPFGAIPL
jgi:hypothetical protein